MADLSQTYNDCAKELDTAVTGGLTKGRLGTHIASSLLKRIAEATTPAEQKAGFDSLEAFYRGALQAQPDMTKARTIITRHLNI